MRLAARLMLFAAAASCIASCGKPAPAAPAPSAPAQTSQPIVSALPLPNFTEIGDYALLTESGDQIKVGDPIEAFNTAFPKPSTTRAFLLKELPNGKTETGEAYTVTGWSMSDGLQGAGALVYQGRIALAMLQLEGLDEKAVQNQVDAYEKAFKGARTLTGPRVRYWFWTGDKPQVLMLCAYQTDRGNQNLTVTVGDSALMDVLRMSPDKAMLDRDQLQKTRLPGGRSE